MSAPAPMWVRVGGGMESVPEHVRHGPADLHFPPPGENLDAAVVGSEPVLVEAFTRLGEWLAGDSLRVVAEPMGEWWKIRATVVGTRRPLTVPELGEPLIRLIVDMQLDGWLDASRPDGADVYLPAYRPR